MSESLSVNALLAEAAEYDIGLLFSPHSSGGWTIYADIPRWPACHEDQLSQAYDLDTAVAAALLPLREIGVTERRLREEGKLK